MHVLVEVAVDRLKLFKFCHNPNSIAQCKSHSRAPHAAQGATIYRTLMIDASPLVPLIRSSMRAPFLTRRFAASRSAQPCTPTCLEYRRTGYRPGLADSMADVASAIACVNPP